MSEQNVLAARPLGETVPISIGTALAVEAIGQAGNMEVLWINVATLVRNIYESVPTEYRDALTGPGIAAEVLAERRIIDEVVAAQGIKPTYYILGYKDLGRKYPFARLRVPKTELQIKRANLINDAIGEILAKNEDQSIEYDKGSEIRGEPKRALLISHYPTDLLSRAKFTQLRLLESHTGAVKPKSQWNTKLSDGSKYPNVPFNYFTVQLFGDNAGHFDRYPHEVRKAIMELAQVRRWTALTTIDKIRYSLQQMKDQFTARQLLQML